MHGGLAVEGLDPVTLAVSANIKASAIRLNAPCVPCGIVCEDVAVFFIDVVGAREGRTREAVQSSSIRLHEATASYCLDRVSVGVDVDKVVLVDIGIPARPHLRRCSCGGKGVIVVDIHPDNWWWRWGSNHSVDGAHTNVASWDHFDTIHSGESKEEQGSKYLLHPLF